MTNENNKAGMGYYRRQELAKEIITKGITEGKTYEQIVWLVSDKTLLGKTWVKRQFDMMKENHIIIFKGYQLNGSLYGFGESAESPEPKEDIPIFPEHSIASIKEDLTEAPQEDQPVESQDVDVEITVDGTNNETNITKEETKQ